MSSSEHESKVLAGILKGYDAYDILKKWSPEHFNGIASRVVAEVIWAYWAERASIPSPEIVLLEVKKKAKTKDKEKMAFFVERVLKEKVRRSDFGYHIKEVADSWCDRSVKQTIESALDLLDNNRPQDARKALLEGLTGKASDGGEIAKVVDYGATASERSRMMEEQRNNPEMNQSVGTGIAILDAELDGGLRPGELALFLALPGGGKSVGLQDIAIYCAAELGIETCYVTIEMSPDQVALRMDSRLTGIRYKKFRRAQLTPEEEKKWLRKVAKKVPEGKLKIIGVSEGCTSRIIEAELDKLSASGFRAKMVIVDYAGIMSPKSGFYKNASDWAYIGQIMKDLKELALKMWIPMWSAAQLSASAEGKEVLGYEDIALAKILVAANTDAMIGIIQTPPMKALGQARLQFIKAREGYENEFLEITPDWDHIKLSSDTIGGDDSDPVAEEEPDESVKKKGSVAEWF